MIFLQQFVLFCEGRGHRRLAARTYAASCASCVWGRRMPVGKELEAMAPLEGISYERVDFDYGGERYLATGEVITEQQIDELRQFDAIYLGASATRR